MDDSTLGGARYRAKLTTAFAGTDNDVTITAKDPGAPGNALAVEVVVSGNSTALSVTEAAGVVTVAAATDSGGDATSTAQEVVDAINSNAAAVTAAVATGNDGTGVVEALTETPLAGGTEYTMGQTRR